MHLGSQQIHSSSEEGISGHQRQQILDLSTMLPTKTIFSSFVPLVLSILTNPSSVLRNHILLET